MMKCRKHRLHRRNDGWIKKGVDSYKCKSVIREGKRKEIGGLY